MSWLVSERADSARRHAGIPITGYIPTPNMSHSTYPQRGLYVFTLRLSESLKVLIKDTM